MSFLFPSRTWRLSVLGVVVAALAVPGFAQPQISEGPAGRVLQAFLKAFNSADRSQIESYINTYGSTQTADDLVAFRSQTGGFTLLSIERSAPAALNFRVRGNSDNIEAYGALILATTTPPKVNVLSIRALRPGVTIDDPPLDAAERKRVIEGVISNLKENYVYLETAEKMSAALEAHQHAVEYDGITDGITFANRLVDDLRAVSHDKHLRVDYSPFKLPPEQHGPDPAAAAQMRKDIERRNCGFEKLDILPQNVGYVKFNMFANPEICGPTVIAAMSFLAHVDALIFDLRDNGGGDPRMVAFIATFLFDYPVHLGDIYNRKEDSTTQFWTSSYVPGPRLASTPAFVLTSGRTFSGAEDFAYNLQAIKRVTVVGETTGGGAHPVSGHRIDDHFMIGVPFARSINLTTKTNWEGTGVTPDVVVKSSEGLQTAQKLAESKIRANQPQP